MVATSGSRIFFAELLFDGNNGKQTGYLHSFDGAAHAVVSLVNANEFDWHKPAALTRSGRVLAWPSTNLIDVSPEAPSYGQITYLLEFDVANGTTGRIAVPCALESSCALASFAATSDGGLIFFVLPVGDNGSGARIVKWMDADKRR